MGFNSGFKGLMLGRQFIIWIGGFSTKLLYLWEVCGSWN